MKNKCNNKKKPLEYKKKFIRNPNIKSIITFIFVDFNVQNNFYIPNTELSSLNYFI